MLIIGHRGAAAHAPENTLASLRKAWQLGVDWVEVDAQFIDGELILFHDHRLERLTNATGWLRAKSLAELRALDVGQGERMPTLREALDCLMQCQRQQGGMLTQQERVPHINIELKSSGTASPVAALIGEYVNRHGWQKTQFLVSSFDHTELKAFRQLRADIPVAVLVAGAPLDFSTCMALEAQALNIGSDFVTPELVLAAHAQGLQVMVYTVNDPAEARWLRDMGVDGVFSDAPDVVAQL